MSRHNQVTSRPDSPERKLTENEKRPWNPGTTDRKQWENTDGQMIPTSVELRAGNWKRKPEYRWFRFQKQRRRTRQNLKWSKGDKYSRHSRTLAPGTALIIWLDVCLHPILHHTANSACHHISAPVPMKLQTETGKRKWQMSDCVMTGSLP